MDHRPASTRTGSNRIWRAHRSPHRPAKPNCKSARRASPRRGRSERGEMVLRRGSAGPRRERAPDQHSRRSHPTGARCRPDRCLSACITGNSRRTDRLWSRCFFTRQSMNGLSTSCRTSCRRWTVAIQGRPTSTLIHRVRGPLDRPQRASMMASRARCSRDRHCSRMFARDRCSSANSPRQQTLSSRGSSKISTHCGSGEAAARVLRRVAPGAAAPVDSCSRRYPAGPPQLQNVVGCCLGMQLIDTAPADQVNFQSIISRFERRSNGDGASDRGGRRTRPRSMPRRSG